MGILEEPPCCRVKDAGLPRVIVARPMGSGI